MIIKVINVAFNYFLAMLDTLSEVIATQKEKRSLSPRVLQLACEIERLAPSQAVNLLEQLCLGLDEEGDAFERFQAAEMLTSAVYPAYKFSEYSRIFLEDEDFLDYYKGVMDANNWHSLDRKYTLNQLLKMVLYVDGDFAECGTYKGASAYLMCQALSDSDRTVHLFDSFEGLSEPDLLDGDYWVQGALAMPEVVLAETLKGFANYRVYKGWIPDRFSEVEQTEFAFLHIDVDLYKPTQDTLDFFYDRIIPGGIILMDDYGFKSCPGAKLAADEFFADKIEEIVMLPTGQAFVVKR